MTENDPFAKPVETETDIPPIVEENPRSRWLLPGIFVIVASVGGYFILTAEQEIDRGGPASSGGQRFAKAGSPPAIPERPVPEVVAMEEADPVPVPVDTEDDARRTRYNSVALIVKRRSPPIPQSGEPTRNPYKELAEVMEADKREPPKVDRNTQFANRIKDQEIPTVKGTQMQSLDKTIIQGTIIPATLSTAVQSGLPASPVAVISQDVYAARGDRILIPAGTAIYGQANPDVDFMQSSIFIVWTRAVTPEGISIPLNSQSTDALGRGGVNGDVDHHFWTRFGYAILISLFGAGADALGERNAWRYPNQVADQLSAEARNSLEDRTRIPPTIFVDQGSRINITVQTDIIIDVEGV